MVGGLQGRRAADRCEACDDENDEMSRLLSHASNECDRDLNAAAVDSQNRETGLSVAGIYLHCRVLGRLNKLAL